MKWRIISYIPFLKSKCSFLSDFSYLAVYRICFALVCFFTLMAVLMVGAQSSKDARAPIQNGFWGIKYVIVVAIAIGAFFIPAGGLSTAWMWVGMIGGFAFILMQLVLLIDFAHQWAEAWVGEYSSVNAVTYYGECKQQQLK